MPSYICRKSNQLLRRPIAPSQTSTVEQVEKDLNEKNVIVHETKSFVSSCQNLSPVPSVAPTLASDIETGDFAEFQTPANTPRTRAKSRKSQKNACAPLFTGKHDFRFKIEPRYQLSHNYLPKVESPSIVYPYKPRGPDAFPFREPMRPPEVKKELLYTDTFDMENLKFPEFTLNDFQFDINSIYEMPKVTMTKAVLSKQNYKKLTTLFATLVKTPRQEKVNTIQLKGENIPNVQPRIPQCQLLAEIALTIRQQMRELMNEGIHNDITQVYITSNSQLTPLDKGKPMRKKVHDMPYVNEAIVTVPVAKYFQGAKRSYSPFNDSDQSSTITPAELAILDCLVNGGLALSLKAHFIAQLPEITPLRTTLTYLNLSFNNFWVFPGEILYLKQLEVLKMRNNPLKELPQDINRLTKLQTLVVSFCLITSLPLSLYTLPLQFLDLSHNKISFLPNEIKQLKKLRALNLDGNQLAAMPAGSLKLHNLEYLRVYNNYMHPYLWFENSTNTPQRLSDLCALILKQHGLDNVYTEVSKDLAIIINSYTICDCCQGPLYGSGLRLIRPCRKAFGIRRLPFYFLSCSPQCKHLFMSNVESLSEILYLDK
ncbi:uncharacterized protein [Antedon mediterranea]|uniref:uncharacterized protein n=1 Tax=Antedon mediterranea TaxID=105859 RepID=UPI003AF87786